MTNKEIVYQWIDGFNEHNTEKILSLYDENAIHFSPKLKLRQPETNGFVQGKNAMRDWWNDSFSSIPSLRYELKNIIDEGHQVVFEYIRHVDQEEPTFIAEYFETKNGFIVRSKVFHVSES